MADWSQPRTWVDGETIVASILNTHIRDQLDVLHDRERCHLYHSADVQAKNAEWETLRWDSEHMDNNSMHNTKHKNQRITAHNDGLYLVILKVNFNSSTTAYRKIQLRMNSDESETGGHGLGQWVKTGTSSGQTVVWAEVLVKMNPHDHLNAFAYQDSGDKLSVMAGNSTTFFQAIQLSA